jgi:hypothetical protein
MLANGNFGLGTETPNYKLDAVGTVRANIFTSSDSTSYQGLGLLNNTFIGAGNIASSLIVNDIDGARYAISAGGYSLTFSKNVSGTSWATGMQIIGTNASDTTPVVRVTNRLGIGKTPSVALDVNGAALISSTVRATSTGVDGTFGDAYIAQYSVTNAEANAIQTSVSGSANLSGFRFQASNGNLSAARTTIVDFLRDRQIFYGNVGININAPTAKIHAVNDTNGFVARFTGGSSSNVLGGFFANSTAGFASIGVQSNHEFRIFTNDTDRLTINGSTGAATFTNHVTGTCTTSFNGDGFRAIASATGGPGSQPGIGYWTAAGSKRDRKSVV